MNGIRIPRRLVLPSLALVPLVASLIVPGARATPRALAVTKSRVAVLVDPRPPVPQSAATKVEARLVSNGRSRSTTTLERELAPTLEPSNGAVAMDGEKVEHFVLVITGEDKDHDDKLEHYHMRIDFDRDDDGTGDEFVDKEDADDEEGLLRDVDHLWGVVDKYLTNRGE